MTTPKAPTDWESRTRQLRVACTPARLQALADHLGLPVAALYGHDIGYIADDPCGPCWTFPECDGLGNVIGIERRFLDGSKKSMYGGRRGLFLPSGWNQRDGPILVTEGASDALTLHALGLAAVARPNAAGGNSQLAMLSDLLEGVPASKPITILADTDMAGIIGAQEAAQQLADRLGREAGWVVPLDHHKDIRAWAVTQNLPTAGEAVGDDWTEAGDRLKKALEKNAKVYRPRPGNDPAGAAGRSAPASPNAMSTMEEFSAADLMAEDIPAMRWAINGLFPEGLALTAGRPKVGKSWLTLQTALAVAYGGMALGKIPVQNGSVLYLALEDGKRRLQTRVGKILKAQNLTAPVNLTLATAWPRSSEGGIDAIEKWLDRHPDARLVAIDTLARFRDSLRERPRHSSLYHEDYEALAYLQKLALERSITIAVNTHTRKPSNMGMTDFLDEVQSSTGLTGAADVVLVLNRPRFGNEATLSVTGRDVKEQSKTLHWHPEHYLWELIDEAKPRDPEAGLTPDQKRALVILREAKGPLRAKPIANQMNKDLEAVKKMLQRMATDGLITKPSRGLYAAA